MMKAFSMFSGIGGFELGIQMASKEVEVIGYSEIDKYAIQVYEKHFPGVKNYGDATTIRGDELPQFDILFGGFPCQAFSVAGRRQGFLDRTRGTLFFDIARILNDKRPQIVVLENVKGLLSHDKGNTFQTILGTLAGLGYGVEWQVLNSKDFGVPQNRERVYFVGHLGSISGRQIFPITGDSRQADLISGENIAHPLDANYYKGSSRLDKSRRQMVATPSVMLTEKRTDEAKKIRKERKDKDYFPRRVKQLEPRTDDLAGSLTASRDNEHYVMEVKEITRNKAQGQRIYDSDGLAASLKSEGGGWGAKTGLYKVETIAQKVKVRKHEVDVDKLCKLLRESKKISNKEIAENLDVPITMVEHWFRTDASFSIPSAEIWFRLKSLLNITTDEFDLPITEFIEKDNVFDTTNRVYDSKGISATLTATGSETGLYAVVKEGTKEGSAIAETGDSINLRYRSSKTTRGRVGKKIAHTLESTMEQYTIADKPKILDASHRNEGIREYEDVSPTLTSRDYKEPRYVDEGNGVRIRRLTPKECSRLQGFPDDWCDGLSDTQKYKTLGNAVTTTVVQAIMERLL